MRPSRLWQMRRQIFGLGFAQVVACAALLTAVGIATGFPVAPSFVAGAGAGFVLTSTAIVMQLHEERGELASDGGQRIVAILLLEDLMIVPLLAIGLEPRIDGREQRVAAPRESAVWVCPVIVPSRAAV